MTMTADETRVCSASGCDKPLRAKGLCYQHWYRQHTPKKVWTDADQKRCPRCEESKLGSEFYSDPIRGKGTYCKPCTRTKALKDWYSQSPEKRVGSHLRRRFGITVSEYQEMLDQQGGVCAICAEPEAARDGDRLRNLAVDHCHATGAIRGLLCTSCNVSIGRMNDDPARLRAAADYLERNLVR